MWLKEAGFQEENIKKTTDKFIILGNTLDFHGKSDRHQLEEKHKKIKEKLNRFNVRTIGLRGRIIIANALLSSQTTYVTKNMELEKKDFKNIQQTMNGFAHKKKLVSKERKYMTQRCGGLKIPDLHLKYLTNKISWLRGVKREEKRNKDEKQIRRLLGEEEEDGEEDCIKELEGRGGTSKEEDWLGATQPIITILKEYKYPGIEYLQETGNQEIKAVAEIMKQHGYTFWASTLLSLVTLREIIGIGNRKKGKLNASVNKKRKSRDTRYKTIPTWQDSYWIGSSKVALAKCEANALLLRFHTTRPPDIMQATIRNS